MQDILVLFGCLCLHKIFYCDFTYFSDCLVGNVFEFSKFALATESALFSFFTHFKILLGLNFKKISARMMVILYLSCNSHSEVPIFAWAEMFRCSHRLAR